MSHSEPTQTNEDERDVQVPEPEVLPRAKRRRFSAEYKLRILEEVDGCTQRGQIGALLRREGLYSSHLSTWRQQRLLGQLEGLSPKRRGRKPQDPAVEEAARLRRENERLRARLEQAEMIIDVQKKLSQLLGLTPDETEMDESE
jgi:transposase-like protein